MVRWICSLLVTLIMTSTFVVASAMTASAAPATKLYVGSVNKSFTPIETMDFDGETCRRSSASPAFQCESLPDELTDGSNGPVSQDISAHIAMADPAGTSCSVSVTDSSASFQTIRLWEVTAPDGYQKISGEVTLCYTADGWVTMSNTSPNEGITTFWDVQNGAFSVEFSHDADEEPVPTVLYPSVFLTPVCGTSNDPVTPSSSLDYTSGSPVWSGTQVSVAFTMNQDVSNKTFANGLRTTTVTAAERDTSVCPTEQPPTPPVTDPVPPPVVVSPPVVTPPSVPAPTPVAAPKTKVVQKCGANNDRVRVAKSTLFTTTKSKWRKNRLKVTYTARDGYTFSNGSTKLVKTVRDKNRACS